MGLSPGRSAIIAPVTHAPRRRFASLDQFLRRWNEAERKQAIIEELEAEGLRLDPLIDEIGKNLDPFDLICHVSFNAKPLTRRERADNAKKRDVFAKYGEQARAMLEAILAKYQDGSVEDLADVQVLRIPPFTEMGTLPQLVRPFNGRAGFEKAVRDMEAALYEGAA